MSTSLLMTRRFAPLFWTQFFAAFSDNFLKQALIFLVLFKVAGSTAHVLVTLAPASPAIPLVLVPVAIAAAALVAFAGGLLLGRRRKSQRPDATAPSQAVAMKRPPASADDSDEIVDCPACGRQIPALAQVCPRCGVRIVSVTEVPREPITR